MPRGKGCQGLCTPGEEGMGWTMEQRGGQLPQRILQMQSCSPDAGPWELHPMPTCVGPFQVPMAYVLGLSTTCHYQQLGWSLRALPHQLCFLSAETIHPCTGEEPTFGEPTGPGLLGKAGWGEEGLGWPLRWPSCGSRGQSLPWSLLWLWGVCLAQASEILLCSCQR